MWLGWQLGVDFVIRPDFASCEYHTHDSCLADKVAFFVAAQDGGEEAGLEVIDLGARVAEASDFDGRICTDSKDRSPWKSEEVDAASGDVFTHLAGLNDKARFAKLVKQLRVNEVNLTKVGLGRILGNPRAMLHGRARVGVALYS
jgi:hypothetical protein